MAVGDTVPDTYTGTDVFTRLRGLFSESSDEKRADGGEAAGLPEVL
jgi:hypothetical protein